MICRGGLTKPPHPSSNATRNPRRRRRWRQSPRRWTRWQPPPGKSRWRSIATRLRVALDARATRTRAEARRIGSNGTSAPPVVTPCVATLAARAAVAGEKAAFSSLVEYRRRGALERGRLAARAATATASARVKTEVHAVDAAVDAGRTSAPSSAAVAPSAAAELLLANILGFASRPGSPSVTPPLGHPGRVSSPHLPAHDAFVVSNQSTAAAAAAVAPSAATEFLLANILGFASRPGSPSVTPPLGHLGRVSSPHLPAHDAFVVSNQSTAAAATGTTSAPVAANGSRLAGEQLASLHAQFRAEGIQRDAANARRYELLVRQQMAAMRHQDMGQGIGQGMGQGMGWSATAGEERMFAPPRPMSPGTHVVAARKRRNRGGRGGGETRGSTRETCAGVEWRGAHVWRVSVKQLGTPSTDGTNDDANEVRPTRGEVWNVPESARADYSVDRRCDSSFVNGVTCAADASEAWTRVCRSVRGYHESRRVRAADGFAAAQARAHADDEQRLHGRVRSPAVSSTFSGRRGPLRTPISRSTP